MGVKISELPSGPAEQTAIVPATNASGTETRKVTLIGIASLATKQTVGLGEVDNTSDANKPVSTATQTALNLKAPLANPTFTGTVGGITKSMVGLGNVDNTSDANKPVSTATQAALNLRAPINNPTFTGTVGGITKSMVGLGNITVNNAVSFSGLNNSEVKFGGGGEVLYKESVVDGGVF
ncbi:hypothetical protein EBZ39_05190 [bacterium]|nr:hypothetical protein [bacterium]